MKKLKMAVIGAGGRTGTMFCFELQKGANVLGVAREKERDLIANKQLFVERNNESALFDVETIKEEQLKDVDLVLLATKNPVGPIIKYYFPKFEKKPCLILSQNGIAALDDAKKALSEIYGDNNDVPLARLILFNPIDKREKDSKVFIKYSLPLKIAIAQVSGKNQETAKVFKESGFLVEEFSSDQAKDIECSKLFLNLIGMASASRGLLLKQGFEKKESFKEEVESLREYIVAVKKSKANFVNFKSYPVKTIAFLFLLLPLPVLSFFRKIIAKIISKGREGKPKDLDEIDYYNKAVINLAQKAKTKSIVNETIYKRVKKN